MLVRAKGAKAVAIGGSRAAGTADAESGWDLGVCYRGNIDLASLASYGEVHPPGSWARIMNGGACAPGLFSRCSTYNRRALEDDYRLSVLWQIATPVWQAAYDIPSWIWWNHLERIFMAIDDLGCRNLLAVLRSRF